MKLLYHPNVLLKKYCEEVVKFDNDLHTELDGMKTIMDENKGMGLAHNQLSGGGKRMFIMRDLKGTLWEFINPVIIYEEDIQFQEEGCLSFKSITVKVKRPKTISVKALNRTGEPFHVIAQGKEAICIKHEIDHLFGETILDRLSRLEKRTLLKRMKK